MKKVKVHCQVKPSLFQRLVIVRVYSDSIKKIVGDNEFPMELQEYTRMYTLPVANTGFTFTIPEEYKDRWSVDVYVIKAEEKPSKIEVQE